MILIRKAKPGDEQDILLLIKELAVYEKEPDSVENTAEEIHCHLFDERICEAFVAEKKNEIIGFALYYTSYSTWKGKCLYLEDLYVKSEMRSMEPVKSYLKKSQRLPVQKKYGEWNGRSTIGIKLRLTFI